MRHKVHSHSFGRKLGPKKSLFKGLVISLVEHERISTTLAKAKELRRHVEKAITLGKDGTVHNRRVLLSKIGNPTAVDKIVTDLSVRFKTRPGGYTRIIKTIPRPGDKAKMAFIEFVDYKLDTAKTAETTVKGDKGAKAKARAATRTKQAKRKTLRKIQAASRRAARA